MRISDWSSDVCSSDLLWWRTRKSFRLRLWPKRMSRPAIVTHHRDLGIVVAPLLLLSLVTGTMMIFRPFAMAMVAPFGSVAETVKSMEPPKYESGPLAAKRSEEHTSELQSLMRISYAAFCLKTKNGTRQAFARGTTNLQAIVREKT